MIQNEFDTDYNIALASIVVSLLPMVILYVFFQRQFIQGVTAGAVKG
jgi:ABC-type glycerol-3-phosphate transport system permease component